MPESFKSKNRLTDELSELFSRLHATNNLHSLSVFNRLPWSSSSSHSKDAASTFKIKSFVTENANGLCAQRTASNSDKFQKPLVTAYFDVDYVKNVKGTNYWRNRVMKVRNEILSDSDLQRIVKMRP